MPERNAQHSATRRVTSRRGSPRHLLRQPIRVLLIDQRRLLRAALRVLLDREPTIRVVGETDGAGPMPAEAARARPDVLLVNLPCRGRSRLPAIREWREHMPGAKLLVLTDRHDPPLWSEAIQAGAAGIVLSHESPAMLIQAIAKVHAGELWLERALLARTLTGLIHPSHSSSGGAGPSLTAREQTILNHVAAGRSNKQIARQLGLSEITVRHYLTAIFSKCGVRSRCELLAFAYQCGLCDPTNTSSPDEC